MMVNPMLKQMVTIYAHNLINKTYFEVLVRYLKILTILNLVADELRTKQEDVKQRRNSI